jgi:hypothetical protein
MNRAFFLVVVTLLYGSRLILSGAEPAHNFVRWESEISAFEKADRTNPPPQNGLLFIGSSTIRLWKTLAKDFPGQPVINRGFGGCEIVDCTYYADRIVFPYRPKMIFFRCGGNDLWNGKSPEQVFGDLKAFVATVQDRLPDTEFRVISLSPSVARWERADHEKAFNKLVEEYSRQNSKVKYIETYDMVLDSEGKPRPELFVSDKLHFNADGYKLLVQRVRPSVPK